MYVILSLTSVFGGTLPAEGILPMGQLWSSFVTSSSGIIWLVMLTQ